MKRLELLFWQRQLPPSNPEIVGQLFWELEDEIATHDAQIQRLKAQIYAVESSREQLKKSRDMARSILSPIHRIPPEVLLKIFSHLREEINMTPCLHSTLQPGMPVTLSKVCARWRELALCMSSLWSWLKIEFEYSLDYRRIPGEKIKQRVQLYLNRARTSPLTLIFRNCWSQIPVPEHEISHHNLAFTALCRRSSQWTSVTFHSSSTLFQTRPFQQLVKGNLPNLRTLVMHPGYYVGAREDVRIFSQCESLQSLELDFNGGDHSNIESAVPWNQLQTLSINVSYRPFPLNLLSKCRNLHSLELRMIGDAMFKSENYMGGLTLNIHSLSLSLAHAFYHYYNFFSRLSFPNLSSLQIELSCTTGTPSPLLQCLARSSPITSFCLFWRYGTDISIEEHLVPLLQFMPKLESLQIYESIDTIRTQNKICTSRFLKALVVHHAVSGVKKDLLVPNLRNLSLRIFSQDLDNDALYEAVASRWTPEHVTTPETGVVSIRSLEILFIDDVYGDDLQDGLVQAAREQLKSLQDEGLNVSIHNYWRLNH